MLDFQTKKPDLGTFWRALEWKMLVNLYGLLEYFYSRLEYITAIG
jgi:hypothetical protein